jgi:hypothetical protein
LGLFERCLTRGVPDGMLPGPYNNNSNSASVFSTVAAPLIMKSGIRERRFDSLEILRIQDDLGEL